MADYVRDDCLWQRWIPSELDGKGQRFVVRREKEKDKLAASVK